MGALNLARWARNHMGESKRSLYSEWQGNPDPRARARSLRSNATNAEGLLWQHLRKRQLSGYRFRRQQPVGAYIVDFLCFEKRLVVEVDGGQHAESQYDSERTAWLESRGFRVLRFWNTDVIGNVEGVRHAILEALSA